MGYHRYKHKAGGYWRGRSRRGGFYTRRGGCMVVITLAPVGCLVVWGLLHLLKSLLT